MLLLCLASLPAWAQAEKRRPTQAQQPTRQAKAPERESKSAPLPAKQLEEALRLLLRADSLQNQSSSSKPINGLEAGLFINQAITKQGQDFYEAFFTRFEAPPGITDFTITITERRGRGTNALVAVSVNEQELLEIPLQPRYDLIEESAAQAVEVALEQILEDARISRQLEMGAKQPLEVF
jgi:curli production assembly/transport component CsgE